MLNINLSALAVMAISMSAAPAFAECDKASSQASNQSSGYQQIMYHDHGMAKKAAPRPGNIIDVAVGAGSFNTLAAALTAAGLVDTLKGAGPFTVFAPTDAAFAKLPAGTVANLLKPENRAQLTSILTYHVVPGNVTSAALAGKTTRADTVQGSRVTVIGRRGKVTVNGANVISADVAASNGTIHVIDTVLMPPARRNAR